MRREERYSDETPRFDWHGDYHGLRTHVYGVQFGAALLWRWCVRLHNGRLSGWSLQIDGGISADEEQATRDAFAALRKWYVENVNWIGGILESLDVANEANEVNEVNEIGLNIRFAPDGSYEISEQKQSQ